MKKQGSMTHPKDNDCVITDSKEIQMDESLIRNLKQ
jgi:hypothetical protein